MTTVPRCSICGSTVLVGLTSFCGEMVLLCALCECFPVTPVLLCLWLPADAPLTGNHHLNKEDA